jgi:hypothetical protein
MTSLILDNIQLKRESKSFTDCLYAVLTAAGLFHGPKYMLSGLSGMAFKFTVHEQLLPLSVTAYGQWGTEHGPAVDNLGIFTASDGGRTRHPTFRYYQQDAVRWVKQYLDRGFGAIYWLPEFGVIHGYDDEDQVFYVQNGRSKDSLIVLYDNFGLNSTPFWYCRVFGERVLVPLADQVLESLRMAIDDWDTPHKTLPNTDIGSGRLAYTYLIRGLEQGGYNERGAVYILDSYLSSRTEIANYLDEVRDVLSGLDEATHLYQELVRDTAAAASCIRMAKGTNEKRVDRERIGELCAMLTHAQALEEQAVERFRLISAQFPDLKRSTIPRWGWHIPK